MLSPWALQIQQGLSDPHDSLFICTEVLIGGWAWRLVPVISAIWETEVGELRSKADSGKAQILSVRQTNVYKGWGHG
jgi:hypothetical protein